MLRHYDRIGLVSPSVRTLAGYRQYSDDDVRRLFHVEGLRSLGLSLQEITDVLNGVSFSPASMVEQLIARTHERLAQEQELLNRLRQVSASDPTAWSDVLRTISLVRGLDAHNPSARQRFALSLTEEGGHGTVLLAEAALDEADPNVAGALHWVLERAGDDAVPTLAGALNSDDPARRRRAVDALVKIDSSRSRAALADAFHHADPVVSTRATLICGAQGARRAIPALVTLVVTGRDDVQATDVLGTLASQHGHADEVAHALTHALETA